MRYLILALFLGSCAATSVTQKTSLETRDLHGRIKSIRKDSLISVDSGYIPLGTTHFNESGMVTAEKYRRSNSWGQSWESEYSYSYSDRNLLTHYKYPQGSETYIYNESGQRIQETDSDYDGELDTYFRYNKKGQLIKDSCYFSDKTITYDKNIVKIYRHDPRDGDRTKYDDVTFKKLDDKGNVLEEWEGDADMTSFSGKLYTYDSNGQMLSETERRGAEIPFGKGEFRTKRAWEYNSQGDIIKISDFNDNSRQVSHEWNYRFEYDSLGNWIEKYYIYRDGREEQMYRRTIEYYQ